ncbi:MAG TPA: PAS domain S-box protein, partial [Spirochaetota bacterium]|nr:PAS domain S-box protein [Spirochaetota bacterium]
MKNIELLSEIALTFIRLESFDQQMNCTLNIIGKHLDVSRVYVFLDNESGISTSNVYEWCNSGIEPQIDELQDIPYDIIPSWKKILEKEGRIYSENINELPADIVKILAPQEILSLIVYPLVIEQKIRGFIGIDECSQHRKWQDFELDILRTISGIISSSMERNLLQERLVQSENNFRNFFDTIDDFFIIGSMTGDVLYANSAVSHKLGYTSEELKGKKIIELHPYDKREQAMEILTAMFKGESGYCPIELQDKDGNRLPVETRVWMGKWNGEECIFGISKDLTKEQEALQKFTKLFESNPALMAISNVSDRRITDVNIAFLNKLGYKKNEVTGKSTSELEIFADPEKQSEIKSELLATGRVRDVELLVKAKDGTLINGLFSGEIIDNFGIKSFLAVMVDITEQVRLRQEIEEQRKRFNLALEGTEAGLWDWDMLTDSVIYSPLWKSMLGYDDSEVENSFSGWRNLWHPDDAPEIEKAMKDYLEGRTESYEIIHRLRHKNGEWRWILCRGALLKDETGMPYRWVGTNLDVTEEKERSNELERFFSVNLDLLCIADTEGNFIKTNRAWEDILGY